jgi:hypothetical protein
MDMLTGICDTIRRILAIISSDSSLQFSQVDIYYNYAFDLGHSVNPIDAARRLLRADFAGGFRNYATGGQEVADCYRSHRTQYQKYLDAQQALREIQDGSVLKGGLRLLRTGPLLYGPVLLRAIARGFSRETTEPDLSGTQENGHEHDGTTGQVESVVADFVIALFGRLAIQEFADRTVFHEDYLERVPFTRVSLQPFEVEFDDESVCFDVVVTIHRSGAAILSAYATFPHGLGVRKIIELQRMSLLSIDACEVPSQIINRYHSLLYGGPEAFGEEFASTERPGHVCVQFEGETVLPAMFDAYRYSIIEAVQDRRYRSLDSLHASLRCQQYLGYPIIFAKHPGTSTAKSLRAQYPEPLARLIMGFAGSSQLRREKIDEVCKGDLSVTDGHSLYMTEAGAIELYYGKVEHEISNFAPTFMTAALIDILILQRMILNMYAAQLDRVTMDTAGLHWLGRIKQDLLLMLEEYEILGLSHYGSVHEAIQRGQEIMRINDRYALFTERLESIEKLAQVAESERRSARDRFLQYIATVISLVVSLPVLHDIVTIVGGWASVPSWSYPWWIQIPFSWVVRNFKARPTLSTIVAYLVVVVLPLLGIWIVTTIDLLKRKRRIVPIPEAVRSRARTPSPMSYEVRGLEEWNENEVTEQE